MSIVSHIEHRLARLATAYVDGEIEQDTFAATEEAILAERLEGSSRSSGQYQPR